jgi:hypothetical protein
LRARLVVFAGIATLVVGCSALLGIDKEYVEGAADAASGADGTLPNDAFAETGTDALEGSDSGSDAPQIETGVDAGCPGHVCQGVCLAGTSCAGCAGGSLFCSATHACVSACTACQGATTECWLCATATPNGSCEPTATAFCFGAGYTHCSCAGDAGASLCPGATQTCTGGKCATCGELGTDGTKCKSNLDCEQAKQLCH